MERNLAIYAPFASTERLLMALVKAGADRQEMHENLRDHAMQAWKSVQSGAAQSADRLVLANPDISSYLAPDQILSLAEGGRLYRHRQPTCAGNCQMRLKSYLADLQ